MNPYYRSIHDLLLKLHDKRPANKVFKKKTEQDTEFDLTEIGSVNKSKLEYLPMTYIRGMDISDAIIIADECQNLSRDESKFLYTRCSSNVKLIAVGDTEQIDNPGCNQDNNGLN
jgi:PhoH-like ATPase